MKFWNFLIAHPISQFYHCIKWKLILKGAFSGFLRQWINWELIPALKNNAFFICWLDGCVLLAPEGGHLPCHWPRPSTTRWLLTLCRSSPRHPPVVRAPGCHANWSRTALSPHRSLWEWTLQKEKKELSLIWITSVSASTHTHMVIRTQINRDGDGRYLFIHPERPKGVTLFHLSFFFFYEVKCIIIIIISGGGSSSQMDSQMLKWKMSFTQYTIADVVGCCHMFIYNMVSYDLTWELRDLIVSLLILQSAVLSGKLFFVSSDLSSWSAVDELFLPATCVAVTKLTEKANVSSRL